MRTRTWVTVAAGTVVAVLVLGVSGYVLLTRVLPGPWHAAHASQLVADRLVPGQLRVTGATWDVELGGYAVRARLADDPDAEVSWHTRPGSWCGPGSACGLAIPQAVAAARGATAETRALLDAFDVGGCPVVGLARLHSGGDRPAAQVVVALPLATVPTAAPRLDACMRSWARARTDRGLGHGAYASIDLVEPAAADAATRDQDRDDALVARLADATDEAGPSVHSATTAEVDRAGLAVTSAGAGLGRRP